MKIITDLRDRVVDFNTKLTDGTLISKIVVENEAYIVDMNAEVQLFEHGENALGVDISSYRPYSPLTIQIKKMKGQPTNRVTLRDEGDFESSFFLQVNNEQFEIKAADFKTEELIQKYGKAILGLTDANLQELIWQYIFPDLMKEAKETIYGN